jgi:hypothetical protein
MTERYEVAPVVHKVVRDRGAKQLQCATKAPGVVDAMIEAKRAVDGAKWDGVNCGRCLAGKPPMAR